MVKTRHHGTHQDERAREHECLVQPGSERVVGGVDHLGGDAGDRGVLRVLGAARLPTARGAAGLNGVLDQALEVRRDPDGLELGRQVTGELGVDDGAQDGHAEHRAHLPTGVGGRGGHARALRGHHRQGNRGHRHQQHADADTGDGEHPAERPESDRWPEHGARDAGSLRRRADTRSSSASAARSARPGVRSARTR